MNANALSLYGLEIDLNKLEIPGEADSLEQLQIRLKDAEIYTASLVEQYDKQSHLAQSIHREINETNIAVVKLENELNTLQNEKQQARQVYDQTEKELKAKKAEATRIEQEAVNRTNTSCKLSTIRLSRRNVVSFDQPTCLKKWLKGEL